MTDDRRRVSSGTEWEQVVGFSRAVRVVRFIYVSGTTATDERGQVVGPGDVGPELLDDDPAARSQVLGAVNDTRLPLVELLPERVGRKHSLTSRPMFSRRRRPRQAPTSQKNLAHFRAGR